MRVLLVTFSAQYKMAAFAVSKPPGCPQFVHSLAKNRSMSRVVACEPSRLIFDVFETQLGWLALAASTAGLLDLTFGHDTPHQALAAVNAHEHDDARHGVWDRAVKRRLIAFARGRHADFSAVPVDLSSFSDFQRRVFAGCRAIPFGEKTTYGQLAGRIGSPRAARAVGNTMARNRVPLVIPCHRVVPASAGVGNYSAGEGRRSKLRLLESEAAVVCPR